MKFLNKSLLALAAFTALSTQAADQTPKTDLVLDGARWLAKSTGFVCAADATKLVQAPSELAAINLAFETAVTDYTLDNAVIVGSFSPEEGTTCRYSVRAIADNKTKAVAFIESRAYASVGEASCAEGQAILDAGFQNMTYTWKERPGHVLTLLFPSENAAEVCGEGVDKIGFQFNLAGKIN